MNWPNVIAPFIAFGISIAFWPGLAGAATSPRWAIAALSLGFLEWWCLPFVALCFALLSFDAAMHWAIVCAAFCWGLNGQFIESRDRNGLVDTKGNRQIKAVVWAFSIGIGFNGAIAMVQANSGFGAIYQVIAPAGLFVNKNFLGEAACLALIAIATLVPWTDRLGAITKFTIMGLLALAIILSTSRASWLATAIALLLALPSLRWRILAFGAVLCMGGILWFAGFSDSETLSQRWSIWTEAAHRLTWFGNGSYDELFSFGRAAQLHNDWLQLVYELGIFGLVPLAVILAARWNSQAIPFIAALLIIGSFGFPLQMPATAWFAAFVIGHSLGRVIIERRMVLRARSSGDKPSTANGLFAPSA